MPFRVGPWELALILGIVLIIFGAGKLPQIGGAIGKSVKEFRKGRSDESSESQPVVEASTAEAVKEETK
jgi:sec-independent protein translocase protein TatA